VKYIPNDCNVQDPREESHSVAELAQQCGPRGSGVQVGLGGGGGGGNKKKIRGGDLRRRKKIGGGGENSKTT